MELSVDIDRNIIALLALLEKTCIFIRSRCQRTVIEQVIMRYYRFMQLKALYPKERFVPTLDIEIVWQTHLLRPEMYRGDCLRLFGRVIDHSLLLDGIEESGKEQTLANTCRLYEEHFGEPYCPQPEHADDDESQSINQYSLLIYIDCPIPAHSYWDGIWCEFASELPINYENPFSFVEMDIILDSYWFELFRMDMYEVGLKIMSHDFQIQQTALFAAMKRLRKNYERFLYIVAKYSPRNGYDFVHPTYAV